MEWPLKNKPYSKEEYDETGKKEKKLTSKFDDAGRNYIEASRITRLSEIAANISLTYIENKLLKTREKLASLYERAHGEALQMETEHMRLIEDAQNAIERLRVFEIEKLGMQKDSTVTEKEGWKKITKEEFEEMLDRPMYKSGKEPYVGEDYTEWYECLIGIEEDGSLVESFSGKDTLRGKGFGGKKIIRRWGSHSAASTHDNEQQSEGGEGYYVEN